LDFIIRILVGSPQRYTLSIDNKQGAISEYPRTENMNTTPRIQIDPTELSGKRVLVTGGTQGIGEAIVQRLRQAGAKVITTARSIANNLESQDLFIPADLTTKDGIQTVVKGVLARIGGLDILINNVGGSSAPS